MRRVLVATVIAVLVLTALGVAAVSPVKAGQPNADCADFSSTPGHASNAPGSAFNPNGTAGQVYAGQQPQNSINPHSVSQYDVACQQVSNH